MTRAVRTMGRRRKPSDLRSTKRPAEARIAPLQSQIDRLGRQFWVTKAQVVANKYDLSASRYRQAEQDEAYYEAPQVTLGRLRQLEQVMDQELDQLEGML